MKLEKFTYLLSCQFYFPISSPPPLFPIWHCTWVLNRLRPAEPGMLSHSRRLPGSLFDDIVVYSKGGKGEVFKHFSLLSSLFPCVRKWFSLVSKRQWKVSISGFVLEARGKKCWFGEGGEVLLIVFHPFFPRNEGTTFTGDQLLLLLLQRDVHICCWWQWYSRRRLALLRHEKNVLN